MQQPLRQVLNEFGNVPEEVCSTVEQTPGGRARGLFDPKAKDYRAMDVCAFNGSEWRARYDNTGPLPGEGWVLGAKGTRAASQASALDRRKA